MFASSLPIREAALSTLRRIDKSLKFYLNPKLAKIEAMAQNEGENGKKHGFKDSISGLGQAIIGEIETLAGVINADPLAQAEGEYNVEVGTIRDGIEEDLAEKGEGENPAGGSL